MNNTSAFGKMVKKLRIEQNYTHRQIALLTDMSPTFIHTIENTENTFPSEHNIKKLAVTLNADATELIFLAGKIPIEMKETLKMVILNKSKDYNDIMNYLRESKNDIQN
jgi:transcriptional regulator with XRE-family HTH domain